MNKEIWREGWLTKSPPTKRILRARWRRRWFTLKQGELPGQFFLEYYTDRNCRKLKGIIDLDQCEQVDAGLRLDKQKQFQHMFDVKTPRRVYYLAADSEDDMRGWVNCICQVCNLQETKQADERQYYNIGPDLMSPQNTAIDNSASTNLSTLTDTTLLTNTSVASAEQQGQSSLPSILEGGQASLSNTLKNFFVHNNSSHTYENKKPDFTLGYTNRDTILCENKTGEASSVSATSNFEHYTNFDAINSTLNEQHAATIERSHSFRGQTAKPSTSGALVVTHNRTQSLNEQKITGTVKKIPENLIINTFNMCETGRTNSESSPLSTCSGPYIPISECYSGSPVLLNNCENPTTPLNSLDPRFYDTPRSHINIGLNLTSEQPYSPKRNNCLQQQKLQQQQQQSQPSTSAAGNVHPPLQKTQSGHSSPTDSESVFTDDEWSHPVLPQNTLDRQTRPSDSSIENDTIGWTCVQSFAKVSDEQTGETTDGGSGTTTQTNTLTSNNGKAAPPRPPKRMSALILDGTEKSKEQSSDTENASPAMNPKETSFSFVEESYDIPRSHRLPYFENNNNSNAHELDTLSINNSDMIASSTPNLISKNINIKYNTISGSTKSLTAGVNRPHCYTNAAPTKVEGNVFRYDFIEQNEPPSVNRSLKPKIQSNDVPHHASTRSINSIVQQSPAVIKFGPSIDRKLKPTTPKMLPLESQQMTNSMRRKVPTTLTLPDPHDFTNFPDENHLSLNHPLHVGISPKTPLGNNKSEDRLQYLDLDHSNSPQKSVSSVKGSSCSLSVSNLTNGSAAMSSMSSSASTSAGLSRADSAASSAANADQNPGVSYIRIDFVKTKALNIIREDSERAKLNQKS